MCVCVFFGWYVGPFCLVCVDDEVGPFGRRLGTNLGHLEALGNSLGACKRLGNIVGASWDFLMGSGKRFVVCETS